MSAVDFEELLSVIGKKNQKQGTHVRESITRSERPEKWMNSWTVNNSVNNIAEESLQWEYQR